jgi:hypothetical protein
LKLRGYKRILLVLLLVTSVAGSGLAQAGNWYCQNGQPCLTGQASCCPADAAGPARTLDGARQLATSLAEHAAPACGSGAPMACCRAGGLGRTRPPAEHRCCAAATTPSTLFVASAAGAPAAALRNPSRCVCQVLFLQRPVAGVHRVAPLAIPPAVLASGAPLVSREPAVPARPPAVVPPLRHGRHPLHSGRAPPAS